LPAWWFCSVSSEHDRMRAIGMENQSNSRDGQSNGRDGEEVVEGVGMGVDEIERRAV
jgi:hypothetical protein